MFMFNVKNQTLTTLKKKQTSSLKLKKRKITMTAAPSNNKAFILKKIAVKTFLCEHSSTKSQFLQP